MNECSSAIFHVFGAADRFITLPDTVKLLFCLTMPISTPSAAFSNCLTFVVSCHMPHI